MKLIFLVSCVFSVTSCTEINIPGLESYSTVSLSGKVTSLASVNSLGNSSFSCQDPTVYLYSLSDEGSKQGDPIASTGVSSNGEFAFNSVSNFSLSNNGKTEPYVLEIEGCSGTHLNRIVTGSDSQDIHFASTLVYFLDNRVSDWTDIDSSELESLFDGIEDKNSFESSYSVFVNDSAKKAQFQKIFNLLPSVLLEVPPKIDILTFPDIASEGVASPIKVQFNHWDSNYVGYLNWKQGSSSIYKGPSDDVFNYIPTGNSQGERTFTIEFGRKTTVGDDLDTTKPYKSFSFKINIQNAIPAQPPQLSILGASFVNTNAINLQINNGVQRALCASFSKLYLSRNTNVAPTNPAVFDITCDVDGLQSIPKTLPSEGTHVYRLWALDSSNNISSTATSVTVNYSTLGPTVAFTSPSSNSNISANSVNLTGTCDFDSGDVTITGTGILAPATVTCQSNGTFSSTESFSNGEGTKDFIASQTNVYQVTGQATRSFVRDQTAPVGAVNFAGLLASPSNDANDRTLTLTGPGDATLYKAITISSGTCASPGVDTTLSNSTAVALATNYTMSISADATYYVCSILADAAGNWQTSISQSLAQTIDTVDPVLTVSSPADNTVAQNQITIAGSCEAGTALRFFGTGLLSEINTSCSGGVFSQAVFFSAGEGAKNISVEQTDTASNTTTVNKVFIRDNTPAEITQTLLSSPVATNTDSVTFGGACEGIELITVKLNSVNESTTVPCTSNSWSYTVATQTTNATRSYTFSQEDEAGNEGVVGAQWIRDTVAPQILFTGSLTSFAQTTAGDSFTFSGTCENNILIDVTGDDGASTISCSSNAWSYTTSTKLVDQTYNYNFSQTDAANNTSVVIDGDWTRAAALPDLTLTVGTITNNEASALFGGDCEVGEDISVTGAETVTIPCPAGTWSHTTTTLAEGTHNYAFEQTNIGGTTTVNGVWLRDLTAPEVSNASLNNDVPSISTSYSTLSFQGDDALSDVTEFCVQVNDTVAPTISDSCWVAVNSSEVNVAPAPTVNINNFGVFLELTPATYSVYVWVKDEALNISSLQLDGFSNPTGAIGVDYDSIDYIQQNPPTMQNILVSNVTTINNERVERFFNAGETVNIKWTASGTSVSPGAIKLYFSTDDQVWTPINVVGLDNDVNDSCVLDGLGSADDSATGCYTWVNGSPTSDYYRIRVGITDDNGATTFGTSLPINSPVINIIAGNTETGLGGSASSAIFNVYQRQNGSFPSPHQFVITKEGVLYFNDDGNGIVAVDPRDNIVDLHLKKDINCVINDNKINISSACLKTVYAMALDYNNRLWVYDHDRIRRINLDETPITIETVIGGGVETTLPVADARDLQLEAPLSSDRQYITFEFLPNNDLMFSNDSLSHNPSTRIFQGKAFKIYRQGTGAIEAWIPNGIANTPSGSQDINDCGFYKPGWTFNYNTRGITNMFMLTVGRSGWANCTINLGNSSVGRFTRVLENGVITTPHPPASFGGLGEHVFPNMISSRRGDLYTFNREKIYTYDAINDLWVSIYGDGNRGSCADNTDVTLCPGDIDDVYVLSDDRIFFSERGRIRTINADGEVITLFGQSLDFGDGGLAQNARFNFISMVQKASNGNIGILDKNEYKLRELDSGSGLMSTIIGNGLGGISTLGVSAHQTTLPFSSTSFDVGFFFYTPSSDVIVNESLQRIALWDRSSTFLSRVAGQGGTIFTSGDGLIGTNIRTDGRMLPLGAYGDFILQGSYNDYGSGTRDAGLYLHDITDSYRLSELVRRAGTSQSSTSPCSDGTSLLNCGTPRNQGAPYTVAATQFSPQENAWLILFRDQPQRIRMAEQGGTMETLVTIQEPALNFIRARMTLPTRDYLYYCSETNGKINRADFTDPFNVTEITLPWAIESIRCSGQALVYDDSDPSNPKLIFNFIQNGLHGVAEYLL